MNCISSSDNTAPLFRPSDTFAMMIKAPLHPADRVRSTNISVERHGLSLFEDLSREIDEHWYDDGDDDYYDDDSMYDNSDLESEQQLDEDEGEGDVCSGAFAIIKAPLHPVDRLRSTGSDRLRSTNVSVERHCLSSHFADLSREDFDEYDDDDDDSILSDVSELEFEQQQTEEVGEGDIMPSSDDSIRAVAAELQEEDKHQQEDEDENLSLPSSSRLIVSSARSSSNNDGDDHISNDDNKSRSAAQRSSKVQDDIMAALRELTRDLREKMDRNADDDTGEGNDIMPVVSKKSHQCGAVPTKKDADSKRPGPVVTEEKTTRDGTTMMMTLAAKAVELSSSSPPPRHYYYWATTPRRRSSFPRQRWRRIVPASGGSIM